MTVDQSASPYLLVHRTRGHPVLVHHAFGVEVVEGRPFLYVHQHRRVTHPEPTVRSTSAPTVGEHLHERVLVDGVVTFAQSFGSVLVGSCEATVRLAAQPHELVTGPLDLEQTRCPLVERSARLTARLVTGPQAIGESTAHVLVSMFVTTFGREPFGTMLEIMFSYFRGHEVIDGLTSQGQIGTICIHLAVLEQRAIQLSVDKVVIEL